jgi:hypothetical protein
MPVSSSPQDRDPRPTQRINILTPAQWVAWLDRQAAAHHQKRAGVLREIIRQAIEAPEHPPAPPTLPPPFFYVGLEIRSDWLAELDRRAAALNWKRPDYIRALIWAASQES